MKRIQTPLLFEDRELDLSRQPEERLPELWAPASSSEVGAHSSRSRASGTACRNMTLLDFIGLAVEVSGTKRTYTRQAKHQQAAIKAKFDPSFLI